MFEMYSEGLGRPKLLKPQAYVAAAAAAAHVSKPPCCCTIMAAMKLASTAPRMGTA